MPRSRRRSSGGYGDGSFLQRARMVSIHRRDTTERHKANYTSTAKYSILSFVPKALFEQYRRVANVYFTLVAALSLTPFSPIRPWTTWSPLALVLGVSLLKEGIEDYSRHKADTETNNRIVQVLSPHSQKFEPCTWQKVQTGDVVMVCKDGFIPADLVFLSSDTPEGTCYIETMNLDGETNLKIKRAPDVTKDFGAQTLCLVSGQVNCEGPNARLYSFIGNLVLDVPGTSDKVTVPLDPTSILLRGCSLRNTEKIYGLVVYAGQDTKVFMNSTAAPSKRSTIEKTIDRIIIFMFCLLFSYCLISSVYDAWWTKSAYSAHWYMRPDQHDVSADVSNPAQTGLVSFIIHIILYGYLIPISLYVSVEIVKSTQAMVFIAADREMYDEESDTPALARTSNLNEELGMVNTVLTDKTGTLTRNVMEFFKCSIAGVSYGAGVTEVERSNAARRGQYLVDQHDPCAPRYHEQYFNFYDRRLMGAAWTGVQDPDTTEMFFRLLAVCHTVIPDGPPDEEKIRYECESPDEAALVVAAKVFGFFFYKRTNTSVFVRERTRSGVKDVEYEVLNVLEFNSTRKRQSVIIRDPRGRILVFCKGADTVIYERLDHSLKHNEAYKALTNAHMTEYGNGGLRTLCLAYTEVHPAFYASWQARYLAAKTSLVDREAKLEEVSELVERDLRLLGCTAIEDKLQEGVPLAIQQLAQAGIRIWVLTGDKQETAINIGYACSLITETMIQIIVDAGSLERGLHASVRVRRWTVEAGALEGLGASCDARHARCHVKWRPCICWLAATGPAATMLAAADPAATMLHCAQIDELVNAGKRVEAARMGSLLVETQLHEAQALMHQRAPPAASLPSTEFRPPEPRMNPRNPQHPDGFAQAKALMDRSAPGSLFALVIDGKALSFALSGRLKETMLGVGLRCESVVCCRVSPLQKAQVTALVKSHGATTLAIGDGANDVGMIQKAHIGVGISGKEGMQAVMSADFAIAQFRFLVPLLLVHGRWSYKRITRMVLFFFYKNLIFGTSLFVYNGFTAFSGSTMYGDTDMLLFNVVFTSLTPLVIGILDRDVDRAVAMSNPGLYRAGQINSHFDLLAICGWLCSAAVQVAILLCVILGSSSSLQANTQHGKPFDFFQEGIMTYGCIIITVHLQVLIIEEQWTSMHVGAVCGSIAIWWVYLLGFGGMPVGISREMSRLFLGDASRSAQFWLVHFLAPLAAVVPELFFRSVRRLLNPSDAHTMQALQRQLRKQQQQHEAQHGAQHGAQLAFTSGAPPHTPPHPHSHPDSEAQASGPVATDSSGLDRAPGPPKRRCWADAWRSCSVSPNACSLPSILTSPQPAAARRPTTTNSTVILDTRPRLAMELAAGEIPGLHASGLGKGMPPEDDRDSVQVMGPPSVESDHMPSHRTPQVMPGVTKQPWPQAQAASKRSSISSRGAGGGSVNSRSTYATISSQQQRRAVPPVDMSGVPRGSSPLCDEADGCAMTPRSV
ncbi:MAG: hypothetical protein WDW36_008682 [Sanguina aurantia]